MNNDKFLISEGVKLKLKDHDTGFTGDYSGKDEAKVDLAANIKRLDELQEVLYAQNKHALLIIFQAMDAAGKDGAIEHVMSGLNPPGVQVFPAQQPAGGELAHG